MLLIVFICKCINPSHQWTPDVYEGVWYHQYKIVNKIPVKLQLCKDYYKNPTTETPIASKFIPGFTKVEIIPGSK